MSARACVNLEQKLKRLATSLQTPVVPGELESWVGTVRDAANLAAEALQHQIASVHPSEFAQIVKEDPELFRQVEQMKDADRDSSARMNSFRARIGQLAKEAPRGEPNELKLKEQLAEVIDQGLALVLHVQKQEIARRTWLQEAFNRERGVGD